MYALTNITMIVTCIKTAETASLRTQIYKNK